MSSVDLTAERTAVAYRSIEHHNDESIVITLAGGRRVSLPAGQVRIDGNHSVSMPEWLARERELIR